LKYRNVNLRKYIGIPYQDKGSSFDGTDCYGLLRLFYKEELRTILPVYWYDDSRDRVSITSAVAANLGSWQRLEGPEFAAAVLFNIAGLPIHIGCAIDNRRMLHTLVGHNCALESFTKEKWFSRIEGFYRWPRST
jgi:cell wall-associated NlpC family hydrolase